MKKVCDSATLCVDDVKPGDILLYSLKEKPAFVKPFFKNLGDNIFVLFDRLIVWSSNSMTTHAALAYYDKDTVAEATLPRCRVVSPINNDSEILVTVHRLDEQRGLKVLEQLPPLDGESKDNNGYALAQAVLAGLVCMFRMNVGTDTKKRKACMVFIKVLGDILARYLDSLLPFCKNGKQAFFCSQLVAWCYDMTGLKYGDEAYRIQSPSSSKIGDSLVAYLIAHGYDFGSDWGCGDVECPDVSDSSGSGDSVGSDEPGDSCDPCDSAAGQFAGLTAPDKEQTEALFRAGLNLLDALEGSDLLREYKAECGIECDTERGAGITCGVDASENIGENIGENVGEYVGENVGGIHASPEEDSDTPEEIKALGDCVKNLLQKILFAKKPGEDFAKAVIDFQTTFITPADLENVFNTIGVIG